MDAWGTQGIGRGEEEDAVGLEGVMQGGGRQAQRIGGGEAGQSVTRCQKTTSHQHRKKSRVD